MKVEGGGGGGGGGGCLLKLASLAGANGSVTESTLQAARAINVANGTMRSDRNSARRTGDTCCTGGTTFERGNGYTTVYTRLRKGRGSQAKLDR